MTTRDNAPATPHYSDGAAVAVAATGLISHHSVYFGPKRDVI